jgi:hypothetical protein
MKLLAFIIFASLAFAQATIATQNGTIASTITGVATIQP